MIHARSPYIVHVDDVGLEDIEFKLYIYTGTKDTDKDTPEYEFAIDAINGEVTFDISPYILDALTEIVPNNKSCYVWVTTEIDKDTGAGLSGTFSTWEATQLACNGYTEVEDGVNYTTYTINDLEEELTALKFAGPISSAAAFPVSEIASPWDDGELLHWICRDKNEFIQVPIMICGTGGGADICGIRYYDGLGGFTGGSTELSRIEITSADEDESNDNMAYISIPKAARSFSTFTSGIDTMSANIHHINGDCEDIVRVFFLNKFGVAEEIHFAGRMKESYTTQSKSYERSILTGGTYSNWQHKEATYNKTAKEQIEINSGNYPEGYNEQFKQLLLSEYVWIIPKGVSVAAANFIPVVIKDSQMQYKYRRFEKIINYTLTLEIARGHINDIK